MTKNKARHLLVPTLYNPGFFVPSCADRTTGGLDSTMMRHTLGITLTFDKDQVTCRRCLKKIVR